MERYEATGSIEGGRLLIDRDRIAQAIKGMPDGPVALTVRRARAARSVQQNRFLWGVAYALLAEHTGHTADEIHEIAKGMLLPKTKAVCDGNGEVVGEFVIGGSTAALNTQEMGDYIAALRSWSLEKLGVLIPEPE